MLPIPLVEGPTASSLGQLVHGGGWETANGPFKLSPIRSRSCSARKYLPPSLARNPRRRNTPQHTGGLSFVVPFFDYWLYPPLMTIERVRRRPLDLLAIRFGPALLQVPPGRVDFLQPPLCFSPFRLILLAIS